MLSALAPWWPHFLAFAVCILASAFFSGSETALTTLNEAKVHQLIELHGQKATPLRLWLERPNRVLTVILLGNNLVNILASALATEVAGSYFQNSSLGIAVGVTTFLVLVFGEIVPKTYAKHNSERLALAAIHVVRLLLFAFYPVVLLLVGISRFIVRLTGGRLSPPDFAVTEQDIEFLIGLGRREGVLEVEEEQMLHSVLEFSDTVVREVMVPRTNVTAISVDIDRETLLRSIIDAGYSRVPVYEGSLDNVIGLIHAKDLLRELSNGEQTLDLRALLRPVYYVPETMKISDLLKEFQRRKTHLAVVVDEYGGTAGIVAMEDLIEELVGEIHDEYDVEENRFRSLGEGHYLADARIPVDELGELLGIRFPENDSYDTLGGFLIQLRGDLPRVDDRQVWSGLEFIVREADERRLLKIEVITPTSGETEEDASEEEPSLEESGKSGERAASSAGDPAELSAEGVPDRFNPGGLPAWRMHGLLGH